MNSLSVLFLAIPQVMHMILSRFIRNLPKFRFQKFVDYNLVTDIRPFAYFISTYDNLNLWKIDQFLICLKELCAKTTKLTKVTTRAFESS